MSSRQRTEQLIEHTFVSKKNYQCLGLLGVTLFSLSLAQAKPMDAHADASSESTEIVASQSSQSSVSSSKETTLKSLESVHTTDGTSGSQTNQTASSTAETTQTETTDTGEVASKTPVDNTPKEKLSSESTSSALLPKSARMAAPSTAVTPDVPTPSHLVVIKNGDSSVQLDNQLKLSMDQATTLDKVTASNPDNFVLDETGQTATITDPTDTDTVTAVYKNVGTYQGKAISAEVTVGNILKHTEDHPVPTALTGSLAANQIQLNFSTYFGGGIKTYNVGQDEVTIKFFDEAGNQVTINGDGYITVGSLNGPSTSTAGNEYINYTDSANATYVTEDSVVEYQTNPLTGIGNAYVGTTNDFKDVLGAPTSENGAVTFQLSGNAFTFLSGTTRYTLKNANHHWSYTLTTFSSATVAPAVIPTPVLTVDKVSAKAGDAVNYTLDQQVNVLGEDTMLRYQSWSEVVTLPTEVSYQQASLLDSTGAVVSEAVFSWDAKTHQLTVTLPEDYLQNTMALNGETYQIKIGTTVNNGVVNGEVGPASGQVTIDNGSKASNGVSTVYVAPVVSVPVTAKTMTVHYYKKGTTEKLAPDKTFEVVEGQNYVAPEKKIKGYKLSAKIATSGIYSGQSDAVYYYLSEKYSLTINYIDMDTRKLISKDVQQKEEGEIYSVPVLNLQSNGLYVLWDSFRSNKGNMPGHDVIVNVGYSTIIFREKKINGQNITWGVDANNKVRFIEHDFKDNSADYILIDLRAIENGKYIIRPTKQYLVTHFGKSGGSKSLEVNDVSEVSGYRMANGNYSIRIDQNGKKVWAFFLTLNGRNVILSGTWTKGTTFARRKENKSKFANNAGVNYIDLKLYDSSLENQNTDKKKEKNLTANEHSSFLLKKSLPQTNEKQGSAWIIGVVSAIFGVSGLIIRKRR